MRTVTCPTTTGSTLVSGDVQNNIVPKERGRHNIEKEIESVAGNSPEILDSGVNRENREIG